MLVGGPAIKNKLFWFTDYQGTREVLGISTGALQLPTAGERTGDFSATVPGAFSQRRRASPRQLMRPYWAQTLSTRLGYTVTNGEPYGFSNCTSTVNCVFPGNMIPQRAFAPTTLPLEKYIPPAQHRRELV